MATTKLGKLCDIFGEAVVGGVMVVMSAFTGAAIGAGVSVAVPAGSVAVPVLGNMLDVDSDVVEGAWGVSMASLVPAIGSYGSGHFDYYVGACAAIGGLIGAWKGAKAAWRNITEEVAQPLETAPAPAPQQQAAPG